MRPEVTWEPQGQLTVFLLELWGLKAHLLFDILKIILVPSLGAWELADGPACRKKSEILKSRESLQTRLKDCVCWKRFQGELIPSLVCGSEALARKENACLMLSSPVPWAGKERNWMPALAVCVGTKTIQRKHCHFPLICKLQLFMLDWTAEGKEPPVFTCIYWEEAGSRRDAPTCSLCCKLDISLVWASWLTTAHVQIYRDRFQQSLPVALFLRVILEAPGM